MPFKSPDPLSGPLDAYCEWGVCGAYLLMSQTSQYYTLLIMWLGQYSHNTSLRILAWTPKIKETNLEDSKES